MTWINPNRLDSGSQYPQVRSNFHTHAGQIDKSSVTTIADTEALYKKLGYGLLTISSHNYFTDMESGNIPDQTLKYLNGYEHTDEQHMLCLGFDEVFEVGKPYQEIIDEVNKKGGATVLCHPNWKHEEFWTDADLMNLKNYLGLEIFNGVIGRLAGSGIATKEWDMLLTAHKKVWGFGSDDFHLQCDAGRAYNMILSSSNEPKECLDAIKAGNFYVSSGLKLLDFDLDDGVLTAKVTMIKSTHINKYFYRFIGQGGEVLKEEFSEISSCPLKEKFGYVRLQAINEDGAMLWTQPVYTNGWFK